MTTLQQQVEIDTLYSIIDDLNYYQILRIPQDCIQDEIPYAYKSQASHFRPQIFRKRTKNFSIAFNIYLSP